jgi:hypothetical protein
MPRVKISKAPCPECCAAALDHRSARDCLDYLQDRITDLETELATARAVLEREPSERVLTAEDYRLLAWAAEIVADIRAADETSWNDLSWRRPENIRRVAEKCRTLAATRFVLGGDGGDGRGDEEDSSPFLYPDDLQSMQDMVEYYLAQGSKRERRLASNLARALDWIRAEAEATATPPPTATPTPEPLEFDGGRAGAENIQP